MFINLIYFLQFLMGFPIGPASFDSIDSLKKFNKGIILFNENERVVEIPFACDQWYYRSQLFPDAKIDDDNCLKFLDKKIRIIGKYDKTYIGTLSENIFLFSSLNNIDNRLAVNDSINEQCKFVINAYNSFNNYKNANIFRESNLNPKKYLDYCFEIHSKLHFMKEEFNLNEREAVFNIRSSSVLLTFNSKYEKSKNTRFILKVLGNKSILTSIGEKEYPHYLAFQVE
ncbi:hypothetical protein ND860_18535 [Leptospira levettii]|uniref:hypothetical protein n=1 Tax=Leptospira levettii TaxID=2023178 RepID=UPI00223DA0EF|nr:hypothetical protein [Leptospira levettii]MCW7498539.1 hypothetical protein [Leptospira levettii]